LARNCCRLTGDSNSSNSSNCCSSSSRRDEGFGGGAHRTRGGRARAHNTSALSSDSPPSSARGRINVGVGVVVRFGALDIAGSACRAPGRRGTGSASGGGRTWCLEEREGRKQKKCEVTAKRRTYYCRHIRVVFVLPGCSRFKGCGTLSKHYKLFE
jgi:hypothetical protein